MVQYMLVYVSLAQVISSEIAKVNRILETLLELAPKYNQDMV